MCSEYPNEFRTNETKKNCNSNRDRTREEENRIMYSTSGVHVTWLNMKNMLRSKSHDILCRLLDTPIIDN